MRYNRILTSFRKKRVKRSKNPSDMTKKQHIGQPFRENIIIIFYFLFFFSARKREACSLKIDVGLWIFVSEVTHM